MYELLFGHLPFVRFGRILFMGISLYPKTDERISIFENRTGIDETRYCIFLTGRKGEMSSARLSTKWFFPIFSYQVRVRVRYPALICQCPPEAARAWQSSIHHHHRQLPSPSIVHLLSYTRYHWRNSQPCRGPCACARRLWFVSATRSVRASDIS